MWWTHSTTINTSLGIIEREVSLQLWTNKNKKWRRDRIILAFWKSKVNLDPQIQNRIFVVIQQTMKQSI